MSDYYDQDLLTDSGLTKSKLYICLFSLEPILSESIVKLLNSKIYQIKDLSLLENAVDFLDSNQEKVDCLILLKQRQTDSTIARLRDLKLLLPTVIVETEQPSVQTIDLKNLSKIAKEEEIYHQAEIRLYLDQLSEINTYINVAISKFLNLAPDSKFNNGITSFPDKENRLTLQQRHLTEKLKKKLGYLGFYSKRQTSNFYRNLSPEKQQKIYFELSQNYRRILLEYFIDDSPINQLIDEFVDQAFFADISTSQILEIHMELIDEFSHQLQIEGRNDDLLLDYRLPLIDTMAHLCEMYRRSVPGEDISFDFL